MRAGPALLAASLGLFGPVPDRPGEAAPYTFAVVPQGPPAVIGGRWAPVLERISADAGVPLRMKLYERIEDFQADLAAGAFDLGYMNPIQAIRAQRAVGYRPLVRDAKPVRGVFFVGKGSTFDSVASLAGREVAFVGPWSFCSVTLRHEVHQIGVMPRFVGTSANAFKNVLLGLTVAGGVLDVNLDAAPPDVRSQLRVIYRTPPMAPHAIAAHPRVPREVSERIARAVLALGAAEEGRALLAPIQLESPVVADFARDYAPLEHVVSAENLSRTPE